ncbi:MAG: addiction module protein [candidate division KSB1 bacterium]|nr:addiction module protein [candidate division KSB1 bacterium]
MYNPERKAKNIMSLEQIEDKALQLPEADRAKLAQKLLLSLDALSETEIAEDWLIEAQRRARELDAGIVQPISAEEVRRKAQALLR